MGAVSATPPLAGAAGGGCHAGIKVVDSRAAAESGFIAAAAMSGDTTIVSATLPCDSLDLGASHGGVEDCAAASAAADSAPAASAASVGLGSAGAGGGGGGRHDDVGSGGAGGECAGGASALSAGVAAGAPHEGAAEAAGSSVSGMSQAGSAGLFHEP